MPIDLTGQSFNIAQSIIDKGQSLTLDFSVINSGDEEVAPFSFDIYISQDDEITEDDYKLGYYDIITSLEGGESSGNKSFTYKTPDQDSSFWEDLDGSYKVGIIIDPDNEIAESNEDNNSNVGLGIDYDMIEVGHFDQQAELVGSMVSVADPDITPKDNIDLSFIVDNQSSAMANPYSIDIYLSPGLNAGFDDAVRIGIYDIRDVTAGNGDTGVKKFSYKTPNADHPVWGKGDGTYYIALDIDSKDEVSETNEGNNSGQGEGLDYASFSVTGIDQPADLVVQNLDVPENAQPGDTVTVEYEIFNQGGKSAELFAAGFYLFDDEYLANNDSLDYQDVPEVFFSQGSAASSVLSLEPGEGTGIISEEITIPETWEGYSPDANYYLGVEADVFDDIDEGDEANNSLRELGEDYSAIKITQADLVVQNLDVPENAQPGDTVTVEYEIYNQGGQSADLFAAGFYLFDDEYLANNDSLDYQDVPEVFFSQGSAASSVLSLEPGEGTGIISEEITIPETWEGYSPDANYYLGVEADVFDDIDEGDEANNSLRELGKDYSAIEITEADLQTVSFDVDPETIKTGEDFTVEYEITNAGTEAADLFGAGFFIFDEDYLNNHDALDIADAPMVYPLVGDVKDAIISLEPGESTGVVSTELTMPENWEGFAAGSGNYYIGFAADVYDDISESNEMNNSLVGSGIDYLAVMIDVGATEL